MSKERLHKTSIYNTHYNKLKTLSKVSKLTMNRLVAIALDNAFEDTGLGFSFNIDLPDDEYQEYAYAEEAGKIMSFIKSANRPMGLDVLLLLRDEIGIDDRETFLYAFRECYYLKMIEQCTPKVTMYIKEYPEDYYHYRIPKATVTKIKKENKEYEKFLKLKKKYGNE